MVYYAVLVFCVMYNKVVSFEIAFNHLPQLAQASSHDCHVTSYLVKAYLLQSNTARAEEVCKPLVSATQCLALGWAHLGLSNSTFSPDPSKS